MKVVIAMDRAFLTHEGQYFETTCFGRPFFDDYLRVFDSVTVLARAEPVTTLPSGALQSNGGRVSFRTLPNLRQVRWALQGRLLASPILSQEISEAGAVVARVPSELGWWAAQQAVRMNKPYMIEVLSDPTSAYTAAGNGSIFSLFGHLWIRRLRKLAKGAAAASYVNGQTLPRSFPVRDGVPFEAISSIRLDPAGIVSSPRAGYVDTRPLRIITVGSLTQRKAPCDLVEAASILRTRGIDVELDFVGDGPERPRLIAAGERLGLTANMRLHGHVADRSLLNHLLDQSDLYATASSSEGLPRAVLEAMARGLPAVGTRIQGIDEIVRPADLFDVGDIPSLAAIIERLVKTPGLMAEVSAHSLNTVRDYASDVLSPRRIRLYTALRAEAEARRSFTPAAANL